MAEVQRWITLKKVINFDIFTQKIRRCNMLDKNIIGKKFNKLTVIGVERNKRGKNAYLCQCDCGNTIYVTSKKRLFEGRTKSCGCLKVDALKKYSYLIGTKINKWTVLELKRNPQKYKEVFAVCVCECGTISDVNIYNLINNKTKDCGCGRKQMLSETRSKNLVGQKFGRLLVVEQLPESNKFNRRQYRCICDCGNEIITASICLVGGHTHSCGCLNSYYNSYIALLLTNMNITYQPEYVVKINDTNYRYDFYLPDYNLIIEYDGEQHYFPVNFGGWDELELHKKFKATQEHDQIKTQYCADNNINLLRIPYWEKQNIETIIYNHLQRLNVRAS